MTHLTNKIFQFVLFKLIVTLLVLYTHQTAIFFMCIFDMNACGTNFGFSLVHDFPAGHHHSGEERQGQQGLRDAAAGAAGLLRGGHLRPVAPGHCLRAAEGDRSPGSGLQTPDCAAHVCDFASSSRPFCPGSSWFRRWSRC